MSQTISTTSRSDDAQSIAEHFVAALAKRDPKDLAACFHSDVKFRALVPSGFEERKGSSDVIAQLQDWFREADHIELLQEHIDPISDRFHISYHFRESYIDGETEVIQQHAFCDIHDGLIVSIDILCSGHLPDSSGTTSDLAHHKYDAGNLGCGSGLPQEFRHQISSIPVGQVLEIAARDPSAKEDLPSLARLLGHQVLSVKTSPDGIVMVAVQRGH